MLFLILAIFCSAAIALVFKVSESRDMNRYAVTTVNYAAAVIAGAVMLSRAQSLPTACSEIAWPVGLGLGAGVVFFLAFIYYQLSVRHHGVGLSGSFAKLGILVPMSLSLILWRELPSDLQWLGIALAVGSILLVNWPGREGWRKAMRPALLLLFLMGGLAEFSNKIFQKYGVLDHRALFLITTFAVAFLLSLGVMLHRAPSIRRREILAGVAVGVPNLFSSYFLIAALESIKAAVVFPVYSAGTIVVINLVGLVVFREHLTIREGLAILLTCVAMLLVSR